MWILRSSKGREYWLICNKVHNVSRRVGDLIIQEDESISRNHAKIEVSYNVDIMENIRTLPSVTLVDCGSKYGTFVNEGIRTNMRLDKDSEVVLKNGDKIRFGLQWNEWTLIHEPLIITTSTLKADDKSKLQEVINALGGHMVNKWYTSCTHVVMSKLTFTIKVACALAIGIPIVTPEYWSSYLSAVSSSEPSLPNYKDYIPPLAEVSLMEEDVSFEINEKRKNLFKGKVFCFHSVQQLQTFSCMVAAAGGTYMIIDTSTTNNDDLVQPHMIVLRYPFDKNSQDTQIPDSFINMRSYIESRELRLIPESEIGLAILHCSLERYCNPKFIPISPSQRVSQRKVNSLVENESSPLSLTFSREKRIIKAPVLIEGSESRVMDSLPITIEDSQVDEPSQNILSGEESKPNINKTNVEPSKQNVPLQPTAVSGAPNNKKRTRSSEDDNAQCVKRIPSVSILSEGRKSISKLEETRSSFKNAKDVNKAPSSLIVKRNNESFRNSNFFHSEDEGDDDERDMFAFVADRVSPKKQNINPKNSWWNVPENRETERKRKLSENDSEQIEKGDSRKRADLCIDTDNEQTTAELHKREKLRTVVRQVEKVPISAEGFLCAKEGKKEAEDMDSIAKQELSEYARKLWNMTIIDVESLPICLRNNSSKLSQNTEKHNTTKVLNFKKFRKVQPVRESILPCIIGGSDLVATNEVVQNSQTLLNTNDDDDDDDDDDDVDDGLEFVSSQVTAYA